MSPRPLRRILLVEDDPDIQFVARIALETLSDIEVRVCGSGPEALETAPSFRPDLVILDVMMPGMDGPTTLTGLRQLAATREVPAVFMTGKVQAQEIARYRALGAVEVILKPFDPMALPERIASIWASQQRQESGS